MTLQYPQRLRREGALDSIVQMQLAHYIAQHAKKLEKPVPFVRKTVSRGAG